MKKNNIISKNIRIRYPKIFKVGENSVVDDFSYFSARTDIGKNCHIGSGCSIAGGKDLSCVIGDYTSLSSGVKIWCRSNDYVNDLVILNTNNLDLNTTHIEGDVIIGKMCGIGSNTVVMPNNTIPDGTVIGALSFVPPNFKFKPWSVYAGIPIHFIKKRNQKNILRQLNLLQKTKNQ
jgi:acetyltransferase-like isoleucine patch superfamily enzyme